MLVSELYNTLFSYKREDFHILNIYVTYNDFSYHFVKDEISYLVMKTMLFTTKDEFLLNLNKEVKKETRKRKISQLLATEFNI